jgi:phosphocarrier protein
MLRKITISNKLGLHARAASKLVQLTNKFDSAISICKGNLRIDGKSILGILSLAASTDSKIEVEAVGPDEERAIKEIEKLFNNKFGESS